MDFQERIKKAGDPRFIKGIYNYCDRWCERCPFQARCLNFEPSEVDSNGSPAKVDEDKLLQRVASNFQDAIAMLDYVSKKQGIDLAALEPDPEIERKSEERSDKARRHTIFTNSEKYIKWVHQWFESSKGCFSEKGRELKSALMLGTKDKHEADKVINELKESVEVIRWYSTLISAKLFRALSCDDDLFDDEMLKDMPKDSDGSAKVALIGLDKSIQAWTNMQEHFPEAADQILDALAILEYIRKKTEETFPDARAFVRPGFDTGHSPEWPDD